MCMKKILILFFMILLPLLSCAKKKTPAKEKIFFPKEIQRTWNGGRRYSEGTQVIINKNSMFFRTDPKYIKYGEMENYSFKLISY